MKSWKLKVIFLIFILMGTVIFYRLFYLQVLNQDFYRAMAHGQQKSFEAVFGPRGDIFFKGGQILATNVNYKYIVFSPREIKDKNSVVENISRILEIEENIVLEKIEKESFFEEIRCELTIEQEKEIREKNLSGVYIREERKRIYPQSSIASQVVGFLGGENIGQYGLEGYYDNILKGKEIIKERSFWSSLFSEVDEGFIKGSDLFLTIDYNIQFMAESLLKKAEKDFNIESGSIIVINPNSGEIMAMASFPEYDPNYYREVEDMSVFKNPSVQRFFEPGSVFKAITIAAALDQEKITPETKYNDTGEIRVGGHTLRNYQGRSYGEVTMTEILEKSINTGAVYAGQRLGSDLFLEYLERFNFFEPTKIDLQGEVYSENREFKKGYEVNFATASFGHGIEITPIQLVSSFSSIANGGKVVNPHIVSKILKNGEITDVSSIDGEKVISSQAALQTTNMLVSVVEGAFSRRARIPGYYVAGKTGTSQIPWSVLGENKKGYSNKTWQSFVGFAPAFNPEFLILVKLDNPSTSTAEYSAMPIFRDLAKYIIDYLQIPPDYEE